MKTFLIEHEHKDYGDGGMSPYVVRSGQDLSRKDPKAVAEAAGIDFESESGECLTVTEIVDIPIVEVKS